MFHLEVGTPHAYVSTLQGNPIELIDLGAIFRPGRAVRACIQYQPLPIEAEAITAILLNGPTRTVLCERLWAAVDVPGRRKRPPDSSDALAVPTAVAQRNLGLHAVASRRNLDRDAVRCHTPFDGGRSR